MLIPILLLLCAAGTASGQNDARVAEQKRVIAALEKKIAAEEQEIARLKASLTPAEAAEAEYVVHEEVPADQPEEHKACPQCGAPVSDDALFCNKCGAQL